jgi:hypothetical protein
LDGNIRNPTQANWLLALAALDLYYFVHYVRPVPVASSDALRPTIAAGWVLLALCVPTYIGARGGDPGYLPKALPSERLREARDGGVPRDVCTQCWVCRAPQPR